MHQNGFTFFFLNVLSSQKNVQKLFFLFLKTFALTLLQIKKVFFSLFFLCFFKTFLIIFLYHFVFVCLLEVHSMRSLEDLKQVMLVFLMLMFVWVFLFSELLPKFESVANLNLNSRTDEEESVFGLVFLFVWIKIYFEEFFRNQNLELKF